MRPKPIPKQYRVPRPTALAVKAGHPLLRWIRFEWLMVLFAGVTVLLAPVGAVDDAAGSLLVRLVAKRAVSEKSILVYASPDLLSNCTAALSRVLGEGRARGAVLLPPADVICSKDGERPYAYGAVPLVRLPGHLLRFDPFGRVIGFESMRAENADLAMVGYRPARFVAVGPIESTPAVSLAQLMNGDVPTSLLRDRIALVLLPEDEPTLTGARADVRATAGGNAVAALAALLEGGAREPVSIWLAAIVAMAIAAAAVAARGRYRWTGVAAACALGFVILLLGQLGYVALFIRSVLPIFSILVGVGASLALMSLHAWATSKRAIDRASELIERTALFRAQGIDGLHEAEFWPRVAALAAQAHPADFVLMAELPARAWHLRFWPTARADERLVAERRRDIRRTPYCDEQGVPRIRAVQKFLVMPDVPTVVVPLIAMGEIEGYVFLCGNKAETAFQADPGQAERMAANLALLLRRRRLGALRQQDWRRTAGIVLDRPALPLGKLVAGAQFAIDDARLFAALWRDAPIPLLYADSFGDIRIMASAFTDVLPDFGLTLPKGSKDGPLAPGALSLMRVLTALSGKSEADVSSQIAGLTDRDEPSVLPVRSPAAAGAREYELSVRAVRQQVDGVSWTAGYVATLVERAVYEGPSNVRVLPSTTADPLVVFPLAGSLEAIAHAASRRAGRPIRIEPAKGDLSIVGHRGELGRVLEEFLAEAAKRGRAGSGPVLASRERGRWVELTILDVDFGIPASALDKVLIAPSAAPEGLESFASLVIAVEASLGRVKVRAPDGWGTRLILEFIRIQPKGSPFPANDASVIDISQWPQDR